MARLGKAVLGLKDIEVGSEQFDAAVRIKRNDPDRILTALEASPTITVTEKATRWEKRGTVAKAETYLQAMGLVVPIVRAPKDAGAQPVHDQAPAQISRQRWQATVWPVPVSSSRGSTSRQISAACRHRGWKRHAFGGFTGFGTSPVRMMRSRPVSGSGIGMAESRACV